jgi:PD-(D/E)XK nuclease superfamily
MEAALERLLPHIRDAVSQDGPGSAAISTSIADLLPQFRAALQQDEAAAGEDDERIATRATELLPVLHERLQQAHDTARSQLERDQPWGLVSLDMAFDLLGPIGKGRSELMHTQCLASLLDHRAAHGLGVRCLRELLSLLGRKIPGEDVFEQLGKESEANNERLRRAVVYAERCVETLPDRAAISEERRCDLWIELLEEGRSVVVIIENKIEAGEQGSQLSAYEQAVWQWARQNRRLSFDAKLVFLTPEGRPPDGQFDQQLWVPIGYKELAAALTHAGRDAPEPGRTFLMLYVSSILKHILAIKPDRGDLNFVKQLPFMQSVIEQGALHE